jgi:3-oxoacyl-[acyl-carrier-protein] synthase-3
MINNNLFSRISGTGSILPGKAVTNDDLAKKLQKKGLETSDEWIRERTGIIQRYFASDSDTTTSLGLEAASIAMKDAGVTAQDIDLVVVATTTPDYIFPSVACKIQGQLGIEKGAAFDVQAVCSGFVYALTISDLFIKAGQSSCALVIGAETLSDILDWNDRSTCVLFGDGAGAVVLKACNAPGVLTSSLRADGKLCNILKAPARISQGKIIGTPFAIMDGKEVFRKAVDALSSSAEEVLEKAEMSIQDVDWLIPHQANLRILKAVAKRIGIPGSKLIETVSDHANTSAASVPLALDTARKDGRIVDGDLVLIQGVGGGLSWGSSLISM